MRFRPKALILTRAWPGPAVGLGMVSEMKREVAGPEPPLISVTGQDLFGRSMSVGYGSD
jgi:hypothetical protein